MAKGKSVNGNKGATPQYDRGDWKGYVWCDLSDEAKKHFEGWQSVNELSEEEMLMDLLFHGRKVSLRYDEAAGNWCVALTAAGKEIGVERGMYGLTAWRPGLGNAVELAYWKDVIFFQRDWSSGILEQKRFDW